MPEFTLTFDLPDVWLVDHLEKFVAARTAYYRECTEGKRLPIALVADFVGSMELVDLGIVKVQTNVPAMEYALKSTAPDKRPKIDLAIMGIIVANVGAKLEAATSVPLADYLSVLSRSKSTQSDTRNPLNSA